jgi:hypothetical protein
VILLIQNIMMLWLHLIQVPVNIGNSKTRTLKNQLELNQELEGRNMEQIEILMIQLANEYIASLPVGSTPVSFYVSDYIKANLPIGSKVTDDNLQVVCVQLSKRYDFITYDEWFEVFKYSFGTTSRAVGGIVIAGLIIIIGGYFLLKK